MVDVLPASGIPKSMGGLVLALLLAAVSCAPLQAGLDRVTGPPVPADTVVMLRTADADPPPVRPPATGPLRITLPEAVLLSLENNRALMAERLNPSIAQTFADEERAVFDPALGAEVTVERRKGERQARSGAQTEAFTADDLDGVIYLEQYFPTGTTVTLEAGSALSDSSLYEDPFYASRLGLTVTQALLRGFGPQANLARLRQAELDTRMSAFELRGFAESLVAEVERTCWDYALARRRIEIVEESLNVARQQLSETEELITVGRLARAERVAVQAELASQEQALIAARADKETIRLRLLRLLNPPGEDLWQRDIDLVHQPTLPDIDLEPVDRYVAVARRLRPLLNQARLQVQRGDLELVNTRSGLLPLMDLFVTLGKSGYADSFNRSVDRLDGESYDALAGLRLEYPLFNRGARAIHRRAQLTRDQAEKALSNLTQLVEMDVRIAHIEVERTRQQIAATAATRRFDEEKLRTETEKLRVGKSTSFLVAQAQRDLLVSRLNEVQALANYLKALIELYRLDGSLLERRGVAAPGRDPVILSSPSP